MKIILRMILSRSHSQPYHKPHTVLHRHKLILQPLRLKQHFHDVEADAATISVSWRLAIGAVKRVKDVLELLFGERFAGVFDG